MNFLQTSSTRISSDSLQDMLQHGNSLTVSGYKLQPTLNWSFYINEHLAEHIIRYFKILNSQTVKA